MNAALSPKTTRRPSFERAVGAGFARAGNGRRRTRSPWWLAAVALPLVVASDFEYRRREQTASLSGGLDTAVLLEITVYVVIGAVLLFGLFRPGWPRGCAALGSLVGCSVVMALSASYSPYPALAIVRISQLGLVILLAVVIAQCGDRGALHRFFLGFVWLITIAAPVGLVLRDARGPGLSNRYTWLSVHPVNAGIMLGAALVLAVFYSLGLGERAVRVNRLVYSLVATALAAFLVATGTRTAGIAASAAVVVLLFASRREGSRRLVMAALVLVVSFVLAFGRGAVVGYIERGQSAEKVSDLNTRTEVWKTAARVIGESPVIGKGYLATRGVFLDEFDLGGAHNALVEVAVNAGLLGAAAYVGMLIVTGTTIASFRRRVQTATIRADSSLMATLFTYLVITSLTSGGLGQAANVQSLLFAVLVGWLGASARGVTTPRGHVVRAATSGAVPSRLAQHI